MSISISLGIPFHHLGLEYDIFNFTDQAVFIDLSVNYRNQPYPKMVQAVQDLNQSSEELKNNLKNQSLMKHFVIILLFSITFIISYSQSPQDEYTVGEIKWEKLSYPLTNNTAVTMQVIDPDMNKISSYNDTLKAFAYSDSYPEGIMLTLYENDKNSGIFERTFVISELRSAPNILYTRSGDTITAKYIDATLPSPYLPSEKLELLDTAIVGNRGPPLERVPADLLRIEDLEGNVFDKISTVLLDQQIKIVADITNQMDYDQDFAYIVQIQDEKNVIVSLSWLTGSLTPMQSFSSAQSWIPQNQGKYFATVFVWESINNPSALSPPLSIEIIVKDAVL